MSHRLYRPRLEGSSFSTALMPPGRLASKGGSVPRWDDHVQDADWMSAAPGIIT
ncbi:MAG: hypothetical protein ABIG42_01390 [bacterium]